MPQLKYNFSQQLKRHAGPLPAVLEGEHENFVPSAHVSKDVFGDELSVSDEPSASCSDDRACHGFLVPAEFLKVIRDMLGALETTVLDLLNSPCHHE